MRSGSVGTWGGLLSVFVASLAQTVRPQDKTTVPASVEIVRLDAVVTDAIGDLVRDLTASDFVLLEDGKRQQLTEFVVAGRKAAPRATSEATKTEAGEHDKPGGALSDRS